LIKKVWAALGVKGVLAIASLIVVASAALFSYSVPVTISPFQQLYQGATSGSWTIYVNEEDKVRYLPGGTSQPSLDPDNATTYAFKVKTDSSMNCSIEIKLTAAMSGSKFSKFQITVYSNSSGSWSGTPVNLYTTKDGATTMSYIDGLTTTPGYVHQGTSATSYYQFYLIKVLYTYIDSSEAAISPEFVYTPYPVSP